MTRDEEFREIMVSLLKRQDDFQHRLYYGYHPEPFDFKIELAKELRALNDRRANEVEATAPFRETEVASGTAGQTEAEGSGDKDG